MERLLIRRSARFFLLTLPIISISLSSVPGSESKYCLMWGPLNVNSLMDMSFTGCFLEAALVFAFSSEAALVIAVATFFVFECLALFTADFLGMLLREIP